MPSFTARVLPSSGWYVLTIGTPKADGTQWIKNYRYESISELEAAIAQFDQAGRTVYYGLASHDDNEEPTGKISRRAVTARQFRTLAFDVDVGEDKPYPDQISAATAVLVACEKLGIPEPCLVSSGYGLHCYYPLTMDISRSQWVTISIALKARMESANVQLDTTKISDAAMVLRPVGTTNYKFGTTKPVKLVQDAGVFDPLVLFPLLLPSAPTPNVATPPAPTGAAPRKPSALAEAILSMDYPPANATDIEQKCLSIRAIADCGGNVEEPLWYAALGIAAYCEESESVAYRWSSGHPKFSPSATVVKMAQWKANSGPTTCGYFAKLKPDACAACTFRSKVSSPIQLSSGGGSATIAVADQEIRLPKSYYIRGEKIFRTYGDEEFPVSEYLLFPSRRYKDDHTGKSMCLIEAKMPIEGWKTLPLEMDTLGSGAKEFQVWALNHQLFIGNEALLKSTRTYIMTYLQDLQQEAESEVLCNSFGWLDDKFDAFVLGDRLVRKDTTESVRLGAIAAGFGSVYSPRGDVSKWSEATSVFDGPGLGYHGLVFLMGVGAPLMVGSNLKSLLVNMYSASSGTGKSTTGSFIGSAYGQPDKARLTVEDTQNATFKTMGVYGNLPIYIDEITTIDPKLLPKLVYFLTQGREKKRLTKSGGFQESMEWQTISVASSNQDMYELLSARLSTDGETMRILQFELGENSVFSDSVGGINIGYQLNKFLDKNNGLVGESLVRAIMMLGGPHAVFEAALNKFHRLFQFDFTGKERFWQAAMVVAYATGEICKANGLIQFDHIKCIREGLEYITTLRKEIDSSKLDCFEILGQFISEHQSKTVIWKRNKVEDRTHCVDPVPSNGCVARMEIDYSKTSPFLGGMLYINQVLFGAWCRERGADVKNILAQLVVHGVPIKRNRRLNLMRGTAVALPATLCTEIVMKHSRFTEVMQQNAVGDPPVELKVVAR